MTSTLFVLIIVTSAFIVRADKNLSADSSLWARWWTYDGISGPKYWGILNTKWRLCKEGRRQSPINIVPNDLLYDPALPLLKLSRIIVQGLMHNNGNGVTVSLADPLLKSSEVYVLSGPVSYKYRITDIMVRFSKRESDGSEHRIEGVAFPGEIQLLGYNTNLYKNVTQAQKLSHGLIAIAIFVQVQNKTNEHLVPFIENVKKVKMKGTSSQMVVNLDALIPRTYKYITYEGSQTMPGCYETVTWIIVNRPIFLSKIQMDVIKELNSGGIHNPQTFLEHNIRPVRPTNSRAIRTNINVKPGCWSHLKMSYRANQLHWR